jgi:hypothetical protein
MNENVQAVAKEYAERWVKEWQAIVPPLPEQLFKPVVREKEPDVWEDYIVPLFRKNHGCFPIQADDDWYMENVSLPSISSPLFQHAVISATSFVEDVDDQMRCFREDLTRLDKQHQHSMKDGQCTYCGRTTCA